MHSGLCDGLLTVKDTQRAIDAFRIMAEKHVSGLAVVNNRGALVDVISARDLRVRHHIYILRYMRVFIDAIVYGH